MIRKLALLSIVLALVGGACSDDSSTPDTAAGATSAAGGPGSTTTSASGTSPSGTEAPSGTGTSAPDTTTAPLATLPPLQGLAYEDVAAEIPFAVFAAAVPGGGTVWFLERAGVISRVDSDGSRAVVADLTDRVGSFGIENGLLGMAFHPRFVENGRIFVYYTDFDLDSRIVEFSYAGRTLDPAGERLILEVEQPFDRHKAGMMEFGPDGYLYIALGDGATGGDRAADPFLHHGSILRIDVDGGDPYSIPPENPFADGNEGLPEIWAMGLRNPWRFSIDEGLIYIADVGQQDLEEVNVVPIDHPGPDLGWPAMEGTSCYFDADCQGSDAIRPVVEHTHDDGCSVTGGYVYRGTAIPELVGHYFYSDWCGGWVRSFRYEDGAVVDMREWEELGRLGSISSFGRDAEGELLVITTDGDIARIVPVR